MQVDAAVHESDEMFDGLWKAGILSRDDLARSTCQFDGFSLERENWVN